MEALRTFQNLCVCCAESDVGGTREGYKERGQGLCPVSAQSIVGFEVVTNWMGHLLCCLSLSLQ